MLGISYAELFLLIGATAALVGPKDLPIIARTAGRFAGRAVGYVQMARGQFDNVMQQSQARQVHKELQDTMAQLEAIRYEIRSISFINPGPMTRKLMDHTPIDTGSQDDSGSVVIEKPEEENNQPIHTVVKDNSLGTSGAMNLHAQATLYEKLAESGTMKGNSESFKLDDETDLFAVLPVSAESAGLLPKRKEKANGSDIVLEAVLEADVAHNAKDFFSQAENQIPTK